MTSFLSRFKKEYFWVPSRERLRDASRVGLVQLAYPIILESILRATVGVVDIAFISRIGDEAVSSVSIGNQLAMFCLTLSSAMSVGTTVCVNQAIGMKSKDRIDLFASLGVSFNTLIGIVISILFLTIPRTLLSLMTMEESAVVNAVLYMRITGGLLFLVTSETVLVSLCRSMGKNKAPLIINIISNIVNIIGNYLAVYHGDWFWNLNPVAGVAIATVLSRLTALIIAAILVKKTGERLSLKHLRPFPKDSLNLILSIGIPGGLNNAAYSCSRLMTTSIITLLGLTVMAAKVYVDNIAGYIAIIGMAFGNASAIMVGYRIGAGNYEEAKEVKSIVTVIALCSNAVISLILIMFRRPLIGIFTEDQEILAMACTAFTVDFFVELGRALNNSTCGALQAAGDVTFQLVVNQASAWLVAVGGSYLFGVVLGLGLKGIWMAFACDEFVRGTIMVLRWRSGRWIRIAEAKRKVIAGRADI